MKFIRIFLTILCYLFILTGIILTGLYRLNNKEKKELTDDDRKKAGGQYINLSQGITHYQLAGPDSGQVVVLVHGSSVPYYIWTGTYEYLINKGYRVLRYDQYGRGFSDRPDVEYNKELYLNQLTELIEKLHLRTPVDLAGVSFGGMLVTDFTVSHPKLVRKVVLIDPAYQKRKPAYPQFITNWLEAYHANERANSQVTDFYYPQRHPDWVQQYLVQMQYKGFRHALVSTAYDYNYYGKTSNGRLNATGKPVLLIWGKEDHGVPFNYSDSIRSVLKTQFLPVEKAGHLPYLDQPDIVNTAIAEFLKK